MVVYRSLNAVYVYLAFFKIVDTCETLDQCRFSRSVLTHEGMYLTLAKGKVNMIQCNNAGKDH